MRLKDIMLKDVSKATKEEIKYINNADLKRYVYRKNGEIEYVFQYYRMEMMLLLRNIFIKVAKKL